MIYKNQLDDIMIRDRKAKDRGIILDVCKTYYHIKKNYEHQDNEEAHNKTIFDIDLLINKLVSTKKDIRYFSK